MRRGPPSSARRRTRWAPAVAAALAAACAPGGDPDSGAQGPDAPPEGPAAAARPVVYQVFTRLYGNRVTTNTPWGTIAENGVGKFRDIDARALAEIRALGVTHVWYTGVPQHALIGDYRAFGIADDDPDVVKGRAGSPYAVKDYYNVDPDLAVDPARRLDEFRALVERTHAAGMKAIIDIVPNHVARSYHSTSAPAGVEDFGARDDRGVEYRRDNNYYYVPGEAFRVPEWPPGFLPLGGEPHPLADGRYDEMPARWTGNGVRRAQPSADDWYETVRINYGVRPDGGHDFDTLPPGYERRDAAAHAAFWADRDVPDSWSKFRDIALYWLDQGVDGFRYDMAEMVPVEFWSYLNSAIKLRNPEAFLLAEIYNPDAYRAYLHLGKMDYLYDKVGTYDVLRAIVEGRAGTAALDAVFRSLADIDRHMLRFLENHDEQRIASPAFAGDPVRALPAMTIAALAGRGPVMIYFGQEVGEPGDGAPGFGKPTRTTIFDYWGVPAQQRWMNGGRYDGGALTPSEATLREYYRRLLNLAGTRPAFLGAYARLPVDTADPSTTGDDLPFAFARWHDGDRVIVVSNLAQVSQGRVELSIPPALLRQWTLADGRHALTDLLSGHAGAELIVADGRGSLTIDLDPGESCAFVPGAGGAP